MTQETLTFDRQTQEQMILRALQSGRKIDPMTALNDFGCFRLGGRIYDLRQKGYDIKTEDFKTPSGKHVARYFMEYSARSV